MSGARGPVVHARAVVRGVTRARSRLEAVLDDRLSGIRSALDTPSRTSRMAVVVGRLLATAFLLCFSTGLLSHYLQEPLAWMTFPTRPVFLYQLSQGVHITAGILCFPLILAKLWVIYPQLFQTPPVRSAVHALERASIALFVAASLVEIVIGLLNTYQWYPFPFPFRQTHFALSFVVIGSLVIHIGVKLPVIAQSWRRPADAAATAAGIEAMPQAAPAARAAPIGAGGPPIDPLPATASAARAASIGAGGPGIDPLPATAPAASGPAISALPQAAPARSTASASASDARTSRRGFLVTVTVAAAAIVAFTGGQSFRLLDSLNLFAPRKQGVGPASLPVNRTALAAGVTERATAAEWTLTVSAPEGSRSFSLSQLADLRQYEVRLPIACVEGWSQTATWTGPRVRDLVELVGSPRAVALRATSLEVGSPYAVMEMGPEYVQDELTVVALRLNGEVLDLDHGYPARMIAPGRPGVLQTKWLSSLEMMA